MAGAEEDFWQESGCAWCRGDSEYIRRFGDVIRRIPGDGRIIQEKPIRDSDMIENWIEQVVTQPNVEAIPFMTQSYADNLLAATGFYCYEGGEFACCPSEAYWPSEEYTRPAQEYFFSHEFISSRDQDIPASKTPIYLFPDEEESLLEAYSAALPSSAYVSSSLSIVEEDSLDEEFDEIMSIHFHNLLKEANNQPWG